MATVGDLIHALDTFAPLRYAGDWDNVGLILGSRAQPLAGPVLLTIDLAPEVMEEARSIRASAILAYHPPIFHPIKSITDETAMGAMLLQAITSGMAIVSPHSSLDAAPGGMTDWLCEAISGSKTEGSIAGDVRALTPHQEQPASQQVKVITFVPEKDAEQLRNALASAGAGIIGNYTACSFSIPGTGTFFAGDDASPAVGEVGHLERVPEVRLEMVCSRAALPIAMETLRQFHPYEEPAVDLYELMPEPVRHAGAGRRMVLDRPASPAEIADRLKTFLGIPAVKVATPDGGVHTPVRTVGVCPGAGASLRHHALQARCDFFVTGEMTHHEALELLRKGCGVLLAGHTNTERGYLPRLKDRLADLLPGVECAVSTRDRTPFMWM
ncbi:MAG: Nif3-like dinuclear metal center hexameric protein [Phycisphaeraceae bacterium]|nr:Nif3-like dinuclear metal center hexameric protein [Phycisphaeraceae bacterium]